MDSWLGLGLGVGGRPGRAAGSALHGSHDSCAGPADGCCTLVRGAQGRFLLRLTSAQSPPLSPAAPPGQRHEISSPAVPQTPEALGPDLPWWSELRAGGGARFTVAVSSRVRAWQWTHASRHELREQWRQLSTFAVAVSVPVSATIVSRSRTISPRASRRARRSARDGLDAGVLNERFRVRDAPITDRSRDMAWSRAVRKAGGSVAVVGAAGNLSWRHYPPKAEPRVETPEAERAFGGGTPSLPDRTPQILNENSTHQSKAPTRPRGETARDSAPAPRTGGRRRPSARGPPRGARSGAGRRVPGSGARPR